MFSLIDELCMLLICFRRLNYMLILHGAKENDVVYDVLGIHLVESC